MTGHSEGPWTACNGGKCQCGFIWEATGNVQVASVHGPSALGRDWYGSDTVCNTPTQQANIRLIAAAPDMLAALKFAHAKLNGWLDASHEEAAKEYVRAAIAKAEDSSH